MKLEEIDAKLLDLEKQRMAITEQMAKLHLDRGAITDEAHARAILDGLTPSQRDVVIKAAALDGKAHLPDAK